MDDLGSLIKDILEKRGIWGVVKQQEMLLKWADIVGSDIADHTEAVKITKGILWIKVKDSVWMHHLSMMKMQIKEKVNKFTGNNSVDDLYFFIGEISEGSNKKD